MKLASSLILCGVLEMSYLFCFVFVCLFVCLFVCFLTW